MPWDERNQNAHIYQVDLSMAVFHRVDSSLVLTAIYHKIQWVPLSKPSSVPETWISNRWSSRVSRDWLILICDLFARLQCKNVWLSLVFLVFLLFSFSYKTISKELSISAFFVRNLSSPISFIWWNPFFIINSRSKPASASLNYL